MTAILARALDVAMLDAAARSRGLALVRREDWGDEAGYAAALVGAPGERAGAVVRAARAAGWLGPLLLVLEGCAATGIAAALDAGADDAVAGSAAPAEIVARIAARLREPRSESVLKLGPLRIDLLRRHVTRDGRELDLLPREYALLLHLAQCAGSCVSRAELLAAVWGLRFEPGTKLIEVHVSRLRAKLDRGFATPLLLTEKGLGYRLAAEPRAIAAKPPPG